MALADGASRVAGGEGNDIIVGVGWGLLDAVHGWESEGLLDDFRVSLDAISDGTYDTSIFGQTLDGGAGDDILASGFGHDLMVGGDGSDAYVVYLNSGSDTIDARGTGGGEDTLRLCVGQGVSEGTDWSAINLCVDIDLFGTPTLSFLSSGGGNLGPPVCRGGCRAGNRS